jgi:cytochrome c553
MKLVANIWLCVVCMALPTFALAGAEALYAPCAACHGAAAEGQPALGAPALAAQQEAYLQRQLRHFKEGVRGTHPDDEAGARMRAASATLTDSAISELAVYLAALPVPPVAPGTRADLRNGNNYY